MPLITNKAQTMHDTTERHSYTKAAVLTHLDTRLEIISDIKIPEINTGQVLVKVHYSGICYSQLMEVQGKRGIDKYIPHMLGHEGSGIVISVGKGVEKVEIGRAHV